VVNDVRQTEIYPAEPLVHDPNTFEVEMAIEKLKIHESGSEQIPVEFVNVGDRTMRCGIHKLLSSFWSKEELSEWSQSVYLCIRRVIKQDCSNYRYI
jgi:hypothetical protein